MQLITFNISRDDWTETGFFPYIVFCDYDKFELGNVQRKTVQCTLPINMFNEKVSSFLRFFHLKNF